MGTCAYRDVCLSGHVLMGMCAYQDMCLWGHVLIGMCACPVLSESSRLAHLFARCVVRRRTSVNDRRE